MDRREFNDAVYYICVILQCSETSGFRTQHRNALPEIKGHQFSKHLKGLARDLVPDVNTPEMRRIVVDAARRLGLGALDEGDHVHVQIRKTS